MADGMVYSVKLLLNVDSSQLDAAQKKLIALKAEARKGINTHVGRSSRRNGMPESTDIFRKRWKTFSGNFFQNMFTFSGWGRNLGNLGRVVGGLGVSAGKAVPVLGQVATVLSGIAKIWVGSKILQIGSSGIPLWIGTKALNSTAMGEAASNLMQMRMAEKGLGGNYKSSLNEATRLSTEYGFSRIGMLNAINTFSGLPVNGRKLSLSEAYKMAETAGKIAHVGGLSFERVNVNLQQLLAQAIPSIRDIRELVGQAPFLGKLAMLQMEERGETGDYREWLKDKTNLLSVLDEFSKMIQSHPVMKARGQISVAKENFWMGLADDLSPYWGKIAQANEKLYSWLGDKIVSFVEGIDVDKLGEKLNSFTEHLNNIVTVISYAAKILELSIEGGKFFINPVGYIWNKIFPKKAPKGVNDYTYIPVLTDADRNKFRKRYLHAYPKASTENIEKELKNWEIDVKKDPSLYYETKPFPQEKLAPSDYNYDLPIRDAVPPLKYLDPKTEAIDAYIKRQSINNIINNNTKDDMNRLSDLSNGSKSIFITFNKELINMPVNIASATDVEDIGNRLQPKIEETLIRGLQIALNNATGIN